MELPRGVPGHFICSIIRGFLLSGKEFHQDLEIFLQIGYARENITLNCLVTYQILRGESWQHISFTVFAVRAVHLHV